MKRANIILLFLICIRMLMACTSCTSSGNGNEIKNGETVDVNLNEYRVVRPESTSNDIISAAAKISNELLKKSNIKIGISDDWVKKGEQVDNDIKEILVGNTNRSQSSSVFEKLNEYDLAYSISVIDNKIVIVGINNFMTARGVEYFIENYITKIKDDGILSIKKEFLNIYKEGVNSMLDSGSCKYKIVVSDGNYKNGYDSCIKKIMSCVKDLTGMNISLSVDNAGKSFARDSSTYEILLGGTYYAESIELEQELDYNQYGIKTKGNKIVIGGYSEEAIQKATDVFIDILKDSFFTTSSGEKKINFAGSYSVINNVTDKGWGLPKYNTSNVSIVSCTANANIIYIKDTNAEEYNSYCDKMEEYGFIRHSENNINNNLFKTYEKDKLVANVYYTPSEKTVRIMVDPTDTLPPSESENTYNAITTTTLTQVGLNYLQADCGMSYVIRLADGRFIIFDGGCVDIDEPKKLYDIICAQNATEAKPVIAAWFISHGHGDHIDAFRKFSVDYAQNVIIERVVYDFTNSNFCNSIEHDASFETDVKNIKSAKIIQACTGQKFNIANALIEVLFTPEDFYPALAQSYNDTSVVYRVSVGGQTIMFLGDIESKGSEILCKRYGGTLKSDIMQVAHHGYTGGSTQLFKLINPETLLWPCPSHWYHEVKNWACNSFLASSQNIKQIFVAGNGTDVITLPHTPYTVTKPIYAAGNVIYNENFDGVKNIYDIGWFSLNNLQGTYSYASFALSKLNNSPAFRINGSKNSVVGFLRPEFLSGVNTYTVQMSLSLSKDGKMYIMYNNISPISMTKCGLFDVSNITGYNLENGISLTLEINRSAGTCTAYVNGQYYGKNNGVCMDEGGLYFVVQNATAIVDNIKVTAGTYADIRR